MTGYHHLTDVGWNTWPENTIDLRRGEWIVISAREAYEEAFGDWVPVTGRFLQDTRQTVKYAVYVIQGYLDQMRKQTPWDRDEEHFFHHRVECLFSQETGLLFDAPVLDEEELVNGMHRLQHMVKSMLRVLLHHRVNTIYGYLMMPGAALSLHVSRSLLIQQ